MSPIAYIRKCVSDCKDPKCRVCRRGRRALTIIDKLNKVDQKFIANLVIQLTELEDHNLSLQSHLESLTFNKGQTALISGPN